MGEQQQPCLGVTLRSGSSSQAARRALVTKGGDVWDTPWQDAKVVLWADHLPPGLLFAHELVSLQQLCDTRGWSLLHTRPDSLTVQLGGGGTVAISAQQLADREATAAVQARPLGNAMQQGGFIDSCCSAPTPLVPPHLLPQAAAGPAPLPLLLGPAEHLGGAAAAADQQAS